MAQQQNRKHGSRSAGRLQTRGPRPSSPTRTPRTWQVHGVAQTGVRPHPGRSPRGGAGRGQGRGSGKGPRGAVRFVPATSRTLLRRPLPPFPFGRRGKSSSEVKQCPQVPLLNGNIKAANSHSRESAPKGLLAPSSEDPITDETGFRTSGEGASELGRNRSSST